MIKWAPITFVRIVIFFIGGIVTGIYWPDFFSPLFGLIAVAVLALGYPFCVYLFRRNLEKRNRLNPGLVALPLIFLAGHTHVLFQNQAAWDNHFAKTSSKIKFYTATVSGPAHDKPKSWKLEVTVNRVFTSEWKPATGKVIVYLSKDVFHKPFEYGDIVLIEGSPLDVPPPPNPGEFDYRKYLSYQNIYHQQAIRETHVEKIGHSPSSKFVAAAIKARVWADSVLRCHVTGAREQAIASALVLGVTDSLDNELLSAYAATGTMHVLAVSGLHISIIYMLVLALFKPLKKMPYGEWILAVISLVLLWGYAFVTGLSPSVLRAVAMFTFVAVSKPVGRNTNIYNTMAASAFFLLLLDPFLIMSVGFQLSYLAVIGIVFIHPDLYASWQPRFRIVDEIWKISSVSIAAQLSTFGLGLLYFHQFPNYFLLSNLLVIPISFLVLIDGIAVLAFNWISTLASWLGWALTWLIKGLNLAVFSVEKIPCNLIENIHITSPQCWVLMAFVLATVMLFRQRKFVWLISSFAAILVFSVLQWQYYFKSIDNSVITVYDVRGYSAFDLFDRGQCVFVADSVFEKQMADIRFHLNPNRLNTGISSFIPKSQLPQSDVPGGKILSWKGRLIAMATSQEFFIPDGIQVDWLIVSNNCLKDITKFSARAKQMILDSSNSHYYSKRMVDIAREKQVSVHSVILQGAYQEVSVLAQIHWNQD